MAKWILIAVFLITCVFITVTPCVSATTKKTVIMIGYDETGSYDMRSRGVEMVKRLIASLGPTDTVYVRRINHLSYSESNHLVRLQLPALPPKPSNRLDRAAWSKYRRSLKIITLMKLKAIQIVARQEPQRAPRTDIFGFFAACSERFRAEGDPKIRLIFLCSDMMDNIGRRIRPNLMDAAVYVCQWQHGNNPLKAEKLQKFWTHELIDKCHASEVHFYPPDVRINVSKILTGRR